MTRTEETYLYHKYMYGDCDCYHCEKYKLENLGSKQSKIYKGEEKNEV